MLTLIVLILIKQVPLIMMKVLMTGRFRMKMSIADDMYADDDDDAGENNNDTNDVSDDDFEIFGKIIMILMMFLTKILRFWGNMLTLMVLVFTMRILLLIVIASKVVGTQ